MAYCKRCGFPDELDGRSNDPQQRLAEVEEEIPQLEARLSKRRQQRTALKQQVNARSSPLLKLPLDILSEISLAAFPEGGDTIDGWNHATPLLLGSICHAWRDLAWSMPRLWCTIHVEVFSRYRMLKASLLEEWLSRSRQLPISIHLKLCKPRLNKPQEVKVMWKIMDLVARCSERWQEAHLDILFFFNDVNCYVPKEFPQLRILFMENSGDGFPDDVDLFKNAPFLSDVSLQRYAGTILPTNSLLCLTLGDVSVDNFVSLLKRHPNLVHCAAVIFPIMGPAQLTVEVSSLESLDMMFMHLNSQAIARVLDNLSTPSLRELMIKTQGGVFPYASLISMIQRSSCPLVRLNLFAVHITETQLVECFTILPSLEELELGDMEFGTKAIHQLTLGENSELSPSDTLLPNLTSLSLNISGEVLFDYADLAKMIRSRRRREVALAENVGSDPEPKSVIRMEAISVVGAECASESFPTSAVLAQFKELEDEGMTVHLEIAGYSNS